jgi:LysR family transcriptional regulator, regulator for genes of the gallate degradation pathway
MPIMKDREVAARAAEISFRQLKLFESVGRLESVRRGSEECNLSQPAVTQALSKLEQQLGVVLLERRSSGSYLTEAGRVFRVRVERLFAQMGAAMIDLGGAGSDHAAAAMVNRLSRSQVRSLIAIVETGSFGRAAALLGLTQASLQRSARDLDGNLRRPIFHRAAAGVMVSPDGIELGRRLKLATQEVEWGIREIEALQGSHASHIVIGALPFGGSLLLATVLDEFVARHPHTDVRIVSEGASEMLKRLRAGDVDILVGIVQEAVAPGLSNLSLATTPFEIVVRPGHPLAAKRTVTLADLARYEWIVGADGSSRRSCFDTLFSESAVPASPVTTSSLPIIQELLAKSDRLTVMTAYELRRDNSNLVSLPYGPLEPVPAIGVTTRADWLPTGLHTDFVDLLRQRVTDWHRQTLPREIGLAQGA